MRFDPINCIYRNRTTNISKPTSNVITNDSSINRSTEISDVAVKVIANNRSMDSGSGHSSGSGCSLGCSPHHQVWCSSCILCCMGNAEEVVSCEWPLGTVTRNEIQRVVSVDRVRVKRFKADITWWIMRGYRCPLKTCLTFESYFCLNISGRTAVILSLLNWSKVEATP